MTRAVLLFDFAPWLQAWQEIARRALGSLRDLPPPAFEPLAPGAARSRMSAELAAQAAVRALSPEAREHLETLVEADPFLLRVPADFWRDEGLASPCEALELRAPIVQAKRLPAGTKVSYSHTYALPREGVVATVAIGYGDGYRRCFSSRARMSFAGYPAPVAGRVCMDQTLLDLTGHPRADQAKPGAFVLAAGGPRRPELGGRGCDFMTLCEEFDLPPHELIGGLGPRVEEMGAGQSALEPASRPPRPAALDAASRSFRFEEEADG